MKPENKEFYKILIVIGLIIISIVIFVNPIARGVEKEIGRECEEVEIEKTTGNIIVECNYYGSRRCKCYFFEKITESVGEEIYQKFYIILND